MKELLGCISGVLTIALTGIARMVWGVFSAYSGPWPQNLRAYGCERPQITALDVEDPKSRNVLQPGTHLS